MRGRLASPAQILGALHEGKLSKSDAAQRLKLCRSLHVADEDWPEGRLEMAVEGPAICGGCHDFYWSSTLLLVTLDGDYQELCVKCFNECGLPLDTVIGPAFTEESVA